MNSDKICRIRTNGILSEARTNVALRYDSEFQMQTRKVQDQKATGKCWIYAANNFLRNIICEKYNIDEFVLSANYVSYYDKLEKANYFLMKIIETIYNDVTDRTVEFLLKNPCPDAGQWNMYVNIVQKYGIVPYDLMPDTYCSLNTSEVNLCINSKLQETAARIRKSVGNNMLINEIKDSCLSDIEKILAICFGIPPKVVWFTNGSYTCFEKYNGLTPSQFYENVIDVDLNDYLCLINAPMSKRKYYEKFILRNVNNIYGCNEIQYVNLPIDELIMYVEEQITAGEPVWFGCDATKMVDRKSGVMDPCTFNIEKMLGLKFSMSKCEQLEYYHSAMNHAMLFTGILKKENSLVGYRVEDSHGIYSGNEGFFDMSLDWFKKYVYQVVINKKYLASKVRAVYEKEAIYLEAWDPLGTLAL